jgi:NAD(P)-dependent dehydrogenase (short-subunit alcohol dehydrogenase family)
MTETTLQRVVVVTGASSGIGKATARKFAAEGWHVIGVGRNPQRCVEAEAELQAAAANDGKVDFLRGDFELMADVARVAVGISELTDRVDVLVNNAGNMRDRIAITPEGTEITFASNHLAAVLLTKRLLPLLRAAAKATTHGSTRVLAVSSSGHEFSPPIDWDNLQMKTGYEAGQAYCFAKLANVLFTRELDRRLSGEGIVAQVMHPGVIDSNFISHTSESTQAYMNTLDLNSPDQPAQTLWWMATAPETGAPGGRYFHEMAEAESSPASQDMALAARLWDESEKVLASLGYE